MAIQGNQFGVRAAFDDFAVLQHKDAISEAYGAETVADENGGFAGGKLEELGKDFILGLPAHRTGRLTAGDNARNAHEDKRNRYFFSPPAPPLGSRVPP